MGILGIIGLAIEAIKLIFAIIEMIKHLKKSDPTFVVKDAVKATNEAIVHYRQTGEMAKMEDLARNLKKRCEGVGCPMDTLREEEAWHD